MLVRKVRCPGCGAPKVTPSSTAYVYCDYCARFMDWDFQAASQIAGSALPGPRYEALVAKLRPRLDAARAAGDRNTLAACHRELYTAHMRDCPAAYSPRLGDPDYRHALLARSVHIQVTRELDPACRTADAAVAAAVKALVWTHNQARPDTFWVMYDAIVAADGVVQACVRALPDAAPDPDDTPPELSRIMRDSSVVQSWAPHLDHATASQLLDRTGLRPAYETVADPRLVELSCTSCSAERHAPEGARYSVCEACGQVGELGIAARCRQCGAEVIFAVGKVKTRCSHCRTEARLMAMLD